MMKFVEYFLFVVDKEHWDLIKSSSLITSNHKEAFKNLARNDRILVYVSSISKIMGLYKVISKSNETIIINGREYAYKIELNLLEFFDKSIRFKDIVPKLEFIKNKEKWYTHLGGIKGATMLSLRDYTTLIKSLI